MIRRDINFDARWFYWLCGLMEGEGTFTKATPSMPRKPRLSIRMTDQDIIERVVEMTGTRIWIHEWEIERYRTVYHTELVGGSAVALMNLFRPEMSARRQIQIDRAIATFQPKRSIRHKTYTVLPIGEEERDRYWLAGFLEGEVYFGQNKAATLTISPLVEVNTVDADVIARVDSIWRSRYGIGVNIHIRPPRQLGYQPQYHLACFGPAARAVMADIEPLMGQRRRGRIAKLLGPAVQTTLLREVRAYYGLRWAA